MEIALDSTVQAKTKQFTKEQYNQIAYEKYVAAVEHISKVMPVKEFKIYSLAEQMFNPMVTAGVKQYVYISPVTLEFVVSEKVVSDCLYLFTYHPNPELTSWLVTNVLRKKGITHFINQGVLYAIV